MISTISREEMREVIMFSQAISSRSVRDGLDPECFSYGVFRECVRDMKEADQRGDRTPPASLRRFFLWLGIESETGLLEALAAKFASLNDIQTLCDVSGMIATVQPSRARTDLLRILDRLNKWNKGHEHERQGKQDSQPQGSHLDTEASMAR